MESKRNDLACCLGSIYVDLSFWVFGAAWGLAVTLLLALPDFSSVPPVLSSLTVLFACMREPGNDPHLARFC